MKIVPTWSRHHLQLVLLICPRWWNQNTLNTKTYSSLLINSCFGIYVFSFRTRSNNVCLSFADNPEFIVFKCQRPKEHTEWQNHPWPSTGQQFAQPPFPHHVSLWKESRLPSSIASDHILTQRAVAGTRQKTDWKSFVVTKIDFLFYTRNLFFRNTSSRFCCVHSPATRLVYGATTAPTANQVPDINSHSPYSHHDYAIWN